MPVGLNFDTLLKLLCSESTQKLPLPPASGSMSIQWSSFLPAKCCNVLHSLCTFISLPLFL